MAQDGESKIKYVAFLVYEHAKLEDGTISDEPQITREEVIRKLAQSFGMYAVSPWHQPDEDNDDVHLHVMYRHPAPIYFEGIRKIVNSATLGIPIYNDFLLMLNRSPQAYMRYLLHLDNPEKEQFGYDAKLVDCVNGFPLNLMKELTIAEKLEIQMEIEGFALDFNIYEYGQMTHYLSSHGMMEHYHYFTTHTHHFGKYLDSLRCCAEARKEVDIDS